MASLNEYMHPRNIYKNPLNFVELCSQFPELTKYTTKKPNGKVIFNFKDRDGLRCLCTILLKKDFGLDIIIPENTLIPTLPLRLNYILWIEDLLRSTSKDDPTATVAGIDVGTGATCIYPLLIAKKNSWRMIGTDVTDDIVDMARKNVERNNLNHLISIIKTPSSLSESLSSDQVFDFCMCNPPFFDSQEHELPLPKKRNRAARQRDAKLQAAGTSNEISSPGGEVAFVKNIIEDSIKLQDRIRIYTSMIGCKSSLQPVLDALKENEVRSFCETQFCQGRTMRWAVAWTLTDLSFKSSISSLPPKQKPPKPLVWTVRSKYHFKECVEKMSKMFETLQIRFAVSKQNKNSISWKIEARRNTWTGLRRKRREEQRQDKTDLFEDNRTSSESGQTCSTGVTSVDVTDSGSGKRKTTFEDDKDEGNLVLCKKARVNEDSDILILAAEIELKKVRQNKDSNIAIQVAFLSGQKEAPHQLLHYFKNNLA